MNEYRPDIDGLRMVAIVPVVLYHAGLPFLSGGYVGVDVFFVISGFLITRILHEEITQDRFSLVGFYERRVRRILPALIVVILATLLAGFMILPPEEFANLANSAISASVFSSNIWFWIETSDYFSSEAEFQLLLHTWSLAVEEQFYISFPILLWILSCWRKTITIWVVATLTVFSFLLAVIGVALDQPASFYLAPTRGWELGLGALLALGLSPPLTPRWVREVVAMAGFLAILTAIIFYDATTPFPGFAALLPCLGAAGLIWAGSQGRSLAGQVLSLEPVVSIGLISYSLYLWHWPILAFLRLYVGDVNLSLSLASAGLSAALIAASLSWLYVERPFRRRAPDGFGRGQIFAFSGIATTVVLVLAVGISIGDGLPNRYTTDGIAAIAGGSDRNPDKERCFEIWPRSGLCRFGKETSQDARADFLLWGDSHALALMSGVATAARETEQTGLFAGYPACPPLLGVARVDQGPNHGCTKFNAAVLADLRDRDDAPVVILAARWPIAAEGHLAPNELGGPALLAWADGPDRGPHLPEGNFEIFKRAISETVAAITSTGRQVIILGGVPEIGWNVPRRLGSQLLFGLRLPPSPTIETVSRRQGRAESVLAALATAPDVAYLPLAQLFCDPQCRVSLDGRPLYYDDDHLSHSGSVEIIGALFLEQVWHARNGSVF